MVKSAIDMIQAPAEAPEQLLVMHGLKLQRQFSSISQGNYEPLLHLRVPLVVLHLKKLHIQPWLSLQQQLSELEFASACNIHLPAPTGFEAADHWPVGANN